MKKFVLIPLFLTLGILASCTNTPQSPSTQTGTGTPENTTISGSGMHEVISSSGAHESTDITDSGSISDTKKPKSDTIIPDTRAKIHYTLREGSATGKVIETTQASIAQDNNIFLTGHAYEPALMQISSGQLIAGFYQNLLGMKAGDKKDFLVPPELGYGTGGAVEEVAIELVAPTFTTTITMDELNQSKEDPSSPLYQKEVKKGLQVTDAMGNVYTIKDITDTAATLDIVSSTTPFTKENFKTGGTIEQGNMTAVIREIREKTVVMEFQTPLVGKTLHFDVEVVSIEE